MTAPRRVILVPALAAALALLAAVAALVAPVSGSAQVAVLAADDAPGGGGSREYAVKAACLYHFVQFVEWPADAFAGGGGPDDPIVITVLGRNPFGDVLERLVGGKRANGRRIEVRYAREPEQIGLACHVLFVPAAERERWAEARRRLKGQSVLTVGEAEGFAQDGGGIIRFFQADGKVRFEINPRAAGEARLKISSQLLKLARVVGQ